MYLKLAKDGKKSQNETESHSGSSADMAPPLPRRHPAVLPMQVDETRRQHGDALCTKLVVTVIYMLIIIIQQRDRFISSNK